MLYDSFILVDNSFLNEEIACFGASITICRVVDALKKCWAATNDNKVFPESWLMVYDTVKIR